MLCRGVISLMPKVLMCLHKYNPDNKGQSQLAYLCMKYHFIANVHITETIHTPFCSNMIKIILLDEQKHTQKQSFLNKQLKIKQNTAISRCTGTLI